MSTDTFSLEFVVLGVVCSSADSGFMSPAAALLSPGHHHHVFATVSTIDALGCVRPAGRVSSIPVLASVPTSTTTSATSSSSSLRVRDVSGCVEALLIELWVAGAAGRRMPVNTGHVIVPRSTSTAAASFALQKDVSLWASLVDRQFVGVPGLVGTPSVRSSYTLERWVMNVFVFDAAASMVVEDPSSGNVLATVSPSDGHLTLTYTTNYIYTGLSCNESGVVTFRIRVLDLSGEWRCGVLAVHPVAGVRRAAILLGGKRNVEVITVSVRDDGAPATPVFAWSVSSHTSTPILTLLQPRPTPSTNTMRQTLRSKLLDGGELTFSEPHSVERLQAIVDGVDFFATTHAYTTADTPTKSLLLEAFRTFSAAGDPRAQLEFSFRLLASNNNESPRIAFSTCASLLHSCMLEGTVDLTRSDVEAILRHLLQLPSTINKSTPVSFDDFSHNVMTYPVMVLLTSPAAYTPPEILCTRCAVLKDIIRSTNARQQDVEAMERIGEALGRYTVTANELQLVLPKFLHSCDETQRARAVQLYSSMPGEIRLFDFLCQWVLSHPSESWALTDRIRFLAHQSCVKKDDKMTVDAFVVGICCRGLIVP
eukprot:PhM_4_TR5267/c0_g1_i1/m.46504